MSRKLIAALALCSVFIGGSAAGHDKEAGPHHMQFAHNTLMRHHFHHQTGRRSHGHLGQSDTPDTLMRH
jgi:hypothetical protein